MLIGRPFCAFWRLQSSSLRNPEGLGLIEGFEAVKQLWNAWFGVRVRQKNITQPASPVLLQATNGSSTIVKNWKLMLPKGLSWDSQRWKTFHFYPLIKQGVSALKLELSGFIRAQAEKNRLMSEPKKISLIFSTLLLFAFFEKKESMVNEMQILFLISLTATTPIQAVLVNLLIRFMINRNRG